MRMPKALYVHVPFCQEICGYCDFVRVKVNHGLIEQYLYGLYQELKAIPQQTYETVYIGGGTPSSLNMSELQSLLEMLAPYAKGCKEYTMEINPESLDPEKAKLIRSYGIKRVSLGVQSFQEDELKQMGRQHDYAMIHESVRILNEADINNISIDLIYALPNQTLEKWEDNLNQALQLDIQHISLYALTIEKNSAFGRQKIKPADPELEALMYEMAIRKCAEKGFERYEISSFTQHHPSNHNINYWKYEDYIGIGPGAVSKYQSRRIENTANVRAYAQGKPVGQIIELSHEDLMFETIMMGLRMKAGIDLEDFQERYGVDLMDHYKAVVSPFIESKTLFVEDNRLKCNEESMLVLHDILVEFLPDTPAN